MRENEELNTLFDDLDFPELELPESADETEDDLQLPEAVQEMLDEWEEFEPISLPSMEPEENEAPKLETARKAEEAAASSEIENAETEESVPSSEKKLSGRDFLRKAKEMGSGAKSKFQSWKDSIVEQKPGVELKEALSERKDSLTERMRQMQEDICDNIEEQRQETMARPEEQDVLREKFDQLKRDFATEAGISLEPRPEPEQPEEEMPRPRASELTQDDIDAFFAAALEKQRQENLKEAQEMVDWKGVPLDGSRVDEEDEEPEAPEEIPKAISEEEILEETEEPAPKEEPPELEAHTKSNALFDLEELFDPEAIFQPEETDAPVKRRLVPSKPARRKPQNRTAKRSPADRKAFAAERKRVLKLARRIQYYGFFGVMLVFFVIGLAFFARPKTSALENRDLTTFPKFTVSGFLNGDYTGEISTWYADTYPLREGLISGANQLKNLYGFRGTQLIGNGNSSGGQEIPDSYEQSDETAAPLASEAPVEETEELEDLEDGTIYDDLAQVGDIYIAGNKGFGVYYFVQSNSDRFVELMNKQYEQIKEEANLYVLVAPISAGVMLDQSVLDTIGASDEDAAIDYLYSGMDENIHTISVFDTLKAHNAEYIYFNTDHHWTSLGAYYAYKEFCKEKGWTAHSLDDFETMEFDNFLGTFYTKSNASPTLAANADTVTAYIPNGTNEMVITTQAGQEYDWKIITDVSTWKNNSYYSCFVGGDEQFGEIHNPEITDGSSIVIVKDSYADAFIPFLVDHYQDIYICDFRYYPGTIQNLVEEKGIDDVLYLVAIGNTSASSGVTNMAARVGE